MNKLLIYLLVMVATLLSLTSCRTTKLQKESSKSSYDSTHIASRDYEKINDQTKTTFEEKDITSKSKIVVEFQFDTVRISSGITGEQFEIAIEGDGAAAVVGSVVNKILNKKPAAVKVVADINTIDKTKTIVNEQNQDKESGKENTHTDISQEEEYKKKERATKGIPIATSITLGIVGLLLLVAFILIRTYFPNIFNRKI